MVVQVLDREVQTSYTLSVMAIDKGTPARTSTLVLTGDIHLLKLFYNLQNYIISLFTFTEDCNFHFNN